MGDPVKKKVGDLNSIREDGSVEVWVWTLTSADPTGTPVPWPEYADRTVTMTGTWGTATGALQYSNDNAAYLTCSNAAGGTALSGKTADFGAAIIEDGLFFRPTLTTPGAGATLTVTLVMRRANPMRT